MPMAMGPGVSKIGIVIQVGPEDLTKSSLYLRNDQHQFFPFLWGRFYKWVEAATSVQSCVTATNVVLLFVKIKRPIIIGAEF